MSDYQQNVNRYSRHPKEEKSKKQKTMNDRTIELINTLVQTSKELAPLLRQKQNEDLYRALDALRTNKDFSFVALGHEPTQQTDWLTDQYVLPF